jgi:hypothetical protein
MIECPFRNRRGVCDELQRQAVDTRGRHQGAAREDRMFAQMPVCVYRHFTGAVCTTSSDDRFAAFSLASGLSKSSDNGALPNIAAPCSAHPVQNFLPGATVAIVGAVWSHGTPQGGAGTGCEAVRCGRAGCEGVGRLRCDLAAPTRNRPSGLASSLSRRRTSRCRHRRTCCRSGQNQTSADGTLQQAIAHTRTCQFTATSRVRSCL